MNHYERMERQRRRAQHELEHQLVALDFTPRTANSLLRSGFVSVAEVRGATDDELMQVRNIGPKALQEIRERLGTWEPPQRLTARCPACDHVLVLSLPDEQSDY